ncbi:hypothetical protein PAHAL_7G294800 [Panicum hallii]|uniref:Uncharacterized protein n=1 Tax=Panicum hallii TaxID=206008 RepID=A0A2T8IDZ4_9POAL|nr:hypothetical protein PAHAL_7G294800 [Panicum hallii]
MLTTSFINLVKVSLEIELAKEEESLSVVTHTLHNVPVVSKKHLFPQEISLSTPMARATDSRAIFFVSQTNQLSATAISYRRESSEILARIVQYALLYL